MAELVYAYVSEAYPERGGGSTPPVLTILVLSSQNNYMSIERNFFQHSPVIETAGIPEDKNEDEKRLKLEKLREEILHIKQKAIAEGKLVYGEKGEFKYALAPNGEKSVLNEKSWLESRTSFFKDWFGDWENDREHSSKVINNNGEPLVAYHGGNKNITTFNKKGDEGYKKTKFDQTLNGIYFTVDKGLARNYTTKYVFFPDSDKQLYSCFLNIRNPEIGKIGALSDERLKSLKENSIDGGFSFREIHRVANGDTINEIVALDPSQIKSIDNNGLYDKDESNIYS